jgi:hypothetical protein
MMKCTLIQALRLCTGRTAHMGGRGIALPFLDHGTRRKWVVGVTPRPLFTPGKTRYPLYRRLDGPHGRSGQDRKISPPPGFDPRTFQLAASRCTDWATRPTPSTYWSEKCFEANIYLKMKLILCLMFLCNSYRFQDNYAKRRTQQDCYTMHTFPKIFSPSLQLKLTRALKSLICPDTFEVADDQPGHYCSMECCRCDLTQTRACILYTGASAHFLCGKLHY